MTNFIKMGAVAKAIETIQNSSMTNESPVAFKEVIENFLPIMLEYNQEVYNQLIEQLLLQVLQQDKEGTVSLYLEKLLFATATPDIVFPPMGEHFLDEHNNLQIFWEKPINLFHHTGCRDELSFVVYNLTKNKLEHKSFNYTTDETEVDFTFIGLND
ncbi:hypothetical protein HMPREF9713_01131 [Myroides odoratimimus CCUG 12700]|uniref:hypothetical protein n=1 Tax=Myroides odoratimimus TaxID=76832 RepID=UPI0003537B01|nr:hypothetical protein [Myroides odoratimimus]EPH12290.1 hypothetical protein HMPREF9713_01131 [Myroides odoratimimus CCUG 12700]